MSIHYKGHGETCSVVAEMDQEVRPALVGPRVAAGRGRCCSRKAAGPRSSKLAQNHSCPSR
jgi:hypothetical protein